MCQLRVPICESPGRATALGHLAPSSRDTFIAPFLTGRSNASILRPLVTMTKPDGRTEGTCCANSSRRIGPAVWPSFLRVSNGLLRTVAGGGGLNGLRRLARREFAGTIVIGAG